MATKPLRFKTIPAAVRDTTQWASIDTSTFDDEVRERFERYQSAVTFYLGCGKLKESAAAAGVSEPAFIDQVNRCVIATPDGGVLGWAGLIRGHRVNAYRREAGLPTEGSGEDAGYAGTFAKLLREHPSIKKELDVAIRRGVGTKHVRAGTNTVESIFRLFLRLCKAEKIEATSYPFNTKARGRRSVERYVEQKLSTQTPGKPWFGPDATASSSVGNGESSFDLATAPFDMCGVDAHDLPVIGVVRVNGPKGPQNIAVRRIWIYAAVDLDSGVVPGYAVSIRAEPTSLMIEKAFAMAQTPWVPRNLDMHNVRYAEGAGFPVGTIDGLDAYRPCAIRLDNGMPGFSNRVLDKVRKKFGCAVSFGSIGAWWQNPVAEFVFRELGRRGFKRVPSTMGTGPGDPMRDDPVGAAIRHSIEMEELIDLIDIAFANYNVTRTAGAGHQSRLDVMRQAVDPERPSIQPPLSFPETLCTPRLGIAVETAKARGPFKPGNARSVYVQIDKATYTNDALRCRHDLVGEPLTVHIDEDDMRTVEAFLPDGSSLGVLNAREKGWKRTKHSRELRKMINRQRDELPPDSDDFVADYLEHLARKSLDDVKKKPNKISESASQLAEVVRITGLPVPSLNKTNRPALALVVPPPRPVLPTTKRASWST